MTEAKLKELQQMQACIKGLESVRMALNAAENDPCLEIRITATHAGNAYRAFEDMPAYMPVDVYEPFNEAFSEFISTQLCRLQQAFDAA